MGGFSSITIDGQKIRYGDYLRYEGKDYTFAEVSDWGEMWVREFETDSIHVGWPDHHNLGDLDFFSPGYFEFICRADDERFCLANYI